MKICRYNKSSVIILRFMEICALGKEWPVNWFKTRTALSFLSYNELVICNYPFTQIHVVTLESLLHSLVQKWKVMYLKSELILTISFVMHLVILALSKCLIRDNPWHLQKVFRSLSLQVLASMHIAPHSLHTTSFTKHWFPIYNLVKQ